MVSVILLCQNEKELFVFEYTNNTVHHVHTNLSKDNTIAIFSVEEDQFF